MKRAKNLFSEITEEKNLKTAFYKAAKGRQAKSSFLYFRINSDQKLEKLHKQLTILFKA